MGHGGYGKRKTAAAERKKPAGQRRPKTLAVDKKSKANKPKQVSIKNQIRSTERMLRKDLPPEVKEVQEKKLEELKKQQEIHNRLAVERQIFLRDRKIKFFERRKIERRLRRLEKQQRASSGQAQEGEIANQVSQLKEDLEYVRFFPKTEKYVSLFMGGDETEIVDKRNTLRKQIKTNLVAAAASGKDLEETGSEDDGLLDASDDDFFLHGSSSDEADADDELTDKSAREQASSASGRATSGMSSDERNQRQISARALMPPPGPSRKQFQSSLNNKSGFAGSSGKKSYNRADKSTSSNTSSSIDRSSFRKRGPVDSTTGNSGSLSSNSDARNTSSSIDRTSFRKRGPVDSTTGNSGSWSFNSGARKRGPVDSTTGNSGSRSFSSGTRTRGPVDSTTGTSSSHSFNSGTRTRGPVDSITGNSGNLSSNSDARKPRRKRRPKKKTQ